VRPQGYRSGVAAPIAINGKPWGAVLAATSEVRVFSDEEKHGLERFADLVGLAIANADARSRLVARAASDPLTGLANHRTVHETIRREVARAHRHKRSLAVALFDLDHFKEVNDIHGHQVGDLVLEAIANTLQGIARPGDMVGRLGGEEFVWLMPETDALGAYDAAERFRALVGSSEPAPGVSLTISAGICDLEQASSASELMALADGALYWAKAHGRDISFLYTPEVVEALSADDRADRLERTRILTGLRALADALEVMSGVRAYQRTASWKDALKERRDEAGKQFDPALVDLLSEIAPPGAAVSTEAIAR
jgi:diguanylate cyclase (GGDEF)-like protein